MCLCAFAIFYVQFGRMWQTFGMGDKEIYKKRNQCGNKCPLSCLSSQYLSSSALFCLSRPFQPGGIGRGHVRPETAGPPAPWSHPDPEAAGRGGRLWRLQHRAQRPQLLPARMFNTIKRADVGGSRSGTFPFTLRRPDSAVVLTHSPKACCTNSRWKLPRAETEGPKRWWNIAHCIQARCHLC